MKSGRQWPIDGERRAVARMVSSDEGGRQQRHLGAARDSGEEEAAVGGHGEDSDGRREEAAAGGHGEDSNGRWEEVVGASAFGATTAVVGGGRGGRGRGQWRYAAAAVGKEEKKTTWAGMADGSGREERNRGGRRRKRQLRERLEEGLAAVKKEESKASTDG
ncbi:hypothetical protein GW17_00047492 [Ensete ventricosum]|nr:hypothetical protein GW17_00047492 [Ensete ventricosum]